MESKQRTPSVIARLMGLDELPPQPPAQKQLRVLSDNYLRRVASIGFWENHSSHQRRSFRMSTEELQEMKGIFGVLESLKRDKNCNLSVAKRKINSNLSETWEIVSQKFNDTEHFSVDKKIQNSNEFHDAELLLKVENDLLTDSHGERGLDNSHNFVRSILETKDELCTPPTSTVISKPKLGKAENAARHFSPTRAYKGSHSGDGKHKHFLAVKNGKLYDELQESKNLADHVESGRYRSRVPREIAKEITRQMRQDAINNFIEISKVRFGGGDNLAKDSELAMCSSSSQYQSLKSFSDESYTAGEAKKKLLEQRTVIRLARHSSTLGKMLAMPKNEARPRNLVNKLGKQGQKNHTGPSDAEANLGSSIGISSRGGWKDRCIGNKQRFRYCPATTGIGPKSGTRLKALQNDWFRRPRSSVNLVHHESRWQNITQKDGFNSKNSKFSCNKSEPFPSLDSENDHSVKEAGVILDELKNKVEERDLSELYSIVSKSSTCSISCSNPKYNNTMKETSAIPGELKKKFEGIDQSEQKFVVPKLSTVSVDSAPMVADVVIDAEPEVAGRSFRNPEEKKSGPTACILFRDDDDSSSVPQETPIEFPEEGSVSSHCSGSNPESLMCLEAAYQLSPDSVLEPLFKDEYSSSPECFESVGADPHGSSEAYSEGPGMIISSDDDSGEGSVILREENEDIMRSFRVEESRDFSYIGDVLTEAGFHGSNLEMSFDKWHSPECPISPSAFEALEKKYGEQTSWKRSERRLLFDCINSGLVEILKPCMRVPTWAKPVPKMFSSTQSRDVEEELWTLLVSRDKEVSKDSMETVLGREFGSLELSNDLEVIGREVERWLIDELTEEIVSLQGF